MSPEEYKWYVEKVVQRHPSLSLTLDQAEKIYKYELDKSNYSGKHWMSVWEDWDYEESTYQEILTDVQFRIYKNELNEGKDQYTRSLIEQDAGELRQIVANKELINYLENQFLKDLFADYSIWTLWSFMERSKVQYLKSEYKIFLNHRKKQILSNHFREFKTFKPNTLQASLIFHKQLYLVPDYTWFRLEMDEPTRIVAEYLAAASPRITPETQTLITRVFKELADFNEQNTLKHVGKIGGWHVPADKLTAEQEHRNRMMMFLLMDKDNYGV